MFGDGYRGGTCTRTQTEAVRTLAETCSWSPGGSWPDRDTYCRQQVPQLVAWVLIHAHLLHLKLGKWRGWEITASGPFIFLLKRLQRGFCIRLRRRSHGSSNVLLTSFATTHGFDLICKVE